LRHEELVALIERGVDHPGGRWADLGAGEGAFTLALADVIGPTGRVIAVDKDARALRSIGHGIETRVADFTKPLDLHDLDGVVMANSLHFVRDKQPVLTQVRALLRPGGRYLLGSPRRSRGESRRRPWQPMGALPVHVSAVGDDGGSGRVQEHASPEDRSEPLAGLDVLGAE
jgi:SAM-dependent methyltransferase